MNKRYSGIAKAADQSNAWGQYNLGDMYRDGRGVAKDDEQAVFWYRKAAEQGNVSAQETLTSLSINWKDT
jgi:TPR repeat protein